MAQLFISQDRLDAWTVESKVELSGDTLTLADGGKQFLIRPAVRFVSVTGADSDPNQLLNKVKDEEALASMGADHFDTSVILGEVAYDVQPGFIGKPLEE